MTVERQEEQGSSFVLSETGKEVLVPAEALTDVNVEQITELIQSGKYPGLKTQYQKIAEGLSYEHLCITDNGIIIVSSGKFIDNPRAVPSYQAIRGLTKPESKDAASAHTTPVVKAGRYAGGIGASSLPLLFEWLGVSAPSNVPVAILLGGTALSLGLFSGATRRAAEQRQQLADYYTAVLHTLDPEQLVTAPDTKEVIVIPNREIQFRELPYDQASLLKEAFTAKGYGRPDGYVFNGYEISDAVPELGRYRGSYARLFSLMRCELFLSDNAEETWRTTVRKDALFFSAQEKALAQLKKRYEEARSIRLFHNQENESANEASFRESIAAVNAATQSRVENLLDRICGKIVAKDVEQQFRYLHQDTSAIDTTHEVGKAQKLYTDGFTRAAELFATQLTELDAYRGGSAAKHLIRKVRRAIEIILNRQYPQDTEEAEKELYESIVQEFVTQFTAQRPDEETTTGLPTFDDIFHPLSYEHHEITCNPDDLQ